MKASTVNLLFVSTATVLCGTLACFFATPRITAQNNTPAPQQTSASRKPTGTLTFMVFNTPCTVTCFDPNREQVQKAIREIVDSLTKLHQTINAYDKTSELSQLNHTAAQKPFQASPLLWDITLRARQAWELSDHLFDATVGPLLHLWGFHAKRDQMPTQEDIQAARDKVGFQFVKLDDKTRTIRFLKQGMNLDFGGIAKGYALSLAIRIAQMHQLKDYILDLGGNIYCPEPSSQHPDPYVVGIRNPRKQQEIVGAVPLAGQCIATSGNYERQRIIKGHKIGHIMDPRTGRPTGLTEDYESVTAITKDPTLSDVFSTTVFVGGYKAAKVLADKIPGTAFVFAGYDAKGELQITEGGNARFTPLGN